MLSSLDEHSLQFASPYKRPNALGTDASYLLSFRCGHPLGTLANCSGKPTMLSTHQALPILQYKPLKGFMKESKVGAGQNTKQVAVKVSEYLKKVQIDRKSTRLNSSHVK